MPDPETEYVSILVRQKHVPAIYGLIAELEGVNAAPTTEASTVTPEAEEIETWPQDLIERQYKESPDSMKQFMKYLASHPGEERSTLEIADALNAKYGWNTIAGMLGAYGRRLKNRYRRTTMPFTARWDHVEGRQYFTMSPEVAEIINKL